MQSAGPMPFRVEVVQADVKGVQALRFVFDRRLDDPGYHFFLSSHLAASRRSCIFSTAAIRRATVGPCTTDFL